MTDRAPDDGALRRRHLRRIGSGQAIKVAQRLLPTNSTSLRRSQYSWSIASKRALISSAVLYSATRHLIFLVADAPTRGVDHVLSSWG